RARRSGVSVRNAALAHRHRQPGVSGAVRHGRHPGERTGRRRRRGGRLLGRARRRSETLVTRASRAEVERWIHYHSHVPYALTAERTALESALIPVSAYILIACVECYRRYPEIIDEITRAARAEELGRAGHRLATQIDPVHMWAVPNFPLVGRKVLMAAGLVDSADDERRLGAVFAFWSRAAGAYRFDDGTHQASDAGGAATPYRAFVDEIAASCEPVADEEQRNTISRLNALLTSYLFLLWFDTRSGYQDTGPYPLPDGRTLLLRAY